MIKPKINVSKLWNGLCRLFVRGGLELRCDASKSRVGRDWPIGEHTNPNLRSFPEKFLGQLVANTSNNLIMIFFMLRI